MLKRTVVLFIVPFIICILVFFVFFTKSFGIQGVEIPEKVDVPFSHKSHVQDQKFDCDTCHSYYENGRFVGIPTVGTCKSCHAPGTDGISAAMRLPYLEMYKDNQKAWKSVSAQTSLVYFSHQVVIGAKYLDGNNKMGKGAVACGSCHGDVASATVGVKLRGRMLMGQCMDCHRAINVSNKCTVCHD